MLCRIGVMIGVYVSRKVGGPHHHIAPYRSLWVLRLKQRSRGRRKGKNAITDDTAGSQSGGHINPAVTLANCVYRKFPWRKFPAYLIAQVLGAMCAAFVVYGNYRAAIDHFEGGPGIRTVGLNTSSAGIFCTYPAPFMTRTGMFFSEFVCSTILMFCIYAFLDAGAGDLLPLCLFFLIFGIGACFGWETGYAINLARDFGPRLVSYILGYGTDVWTAGGYYFWVSSRRIQTSWSGRLGV